MLVGVGFVSCNAKKDNIEGLATEMWKADAYGCLNQRADLEKSFMDNKEKLKGYSQKEMMQLLGKPDEVELYKRSQKFFIYYLSPGPQCNRQRLQNNRPKSLFIRFSAMDVSNEIFIRSNQIP